VSLLRQHVLHDISKLYRNILSGTDLNNQLNFNSYFGDFFTVGKASAEHAIK